MREMIDRQLTELEVAERVDLTQLVVDDPLDVAPGHGDLSRASGARQLTACHNIDLFACQCAPERLSLTYTDVRQRRISPRDRVEVVGNRVRLLPMTGERDERGVRIAEQERCANPERWFVHAPSTTRTVPVEPSSSTSVPVLSR